MAQAPRKTAGRRGDADEALKTTRKPREVATQDSREVVDYAKQMEEQAEQAAAMERGAPMGRNFSFKGGQMVFDGAPIKDNEVVVIIAAAVIEKSYYAGDYDPDNAEAPICFAFDTDPDNLAPIPEDVADLQNDTCGDCQWNKFGSADRGKGKACKDVRRLALIPAGTIAKNGDIELVTDPKELAKAEFGFAKLPPTSLTPYAAFVRQVANTMKRPPHGIYAIMKCVPDPKNQFVISWEAIDPVDNKCLGSIMPRHEEALKALQQPYTYPSDEERAERAANKKPQRRGAQAPAGNRGKTKEEPLARRSTAGNKSEAKPDKPAARTVSRKY